MNVLLDIRNTIKKKKEIIIFELYLRNYDGGNFYFSIVYNEKIEKYKVLFVPIDAISKGEKVEDYFCYQFIFYRTIEHIKELIYSNEELLQDKLDNCSKEVDSFYIEINMDNKYKLTFTQYIDKKYFFLFDIISIIFEHCPNIVSELCNKLLINYYDNKNIVKIRKTIVFDMDNDSLEKLFSKDIIDSNKKIKIDYLEKIGRKYFLVIDGVLTIVEYYPDRMILNIYSEEELLDEKLYFILKSVKDMDIKEYVRIKINCFDDNVFYYVFDIRDNNFLVINEDGYEEIDIYNLIKEDIKILNNNEKFISKLKKVLEEKYEDFRVEEILNTVLN